MNHGVHLSKSSETGPPKTIQVFLTDIRFCRDLVEADLVVTQYRVDVLSQIGLMRVLGGLDSLGGRIVGRAGIEDEIRVRKVVRIVRSSW